MTSGVDTAHGYRAIAAAVAQQIASGELAAGARLPPVRQAAAQWGVNLNTVQRAYAHLAQQGIVESRAGGGTHVAAAAAHTVAATREQRLRLLLGDAIGTALGLGYSPDEVEAACTGQLARWRETRRARGSAALEGYRDRPRVAAGLRIGGSHDLSLELLAGQLRGGSRRLRVDLQPSSSLGGLFALANGDCDLAGCHLLDTETGDYNVPFVRRVLPGEPVLLVTLAEREQGLIVAAGNPLGIAAVTDLARPGLRYVNRPRGSGTRVLCDWLLARAGVPAATVEGYDREEASHLGVAAAVAAGRADAGLGIQAAARAVGLGFVPLARERYELALRATAADTPPLRRVRAVLRGQAFARAVVALGGYDTRETGRTRRLA
jgi:putative molybdopterin biosynthesis protein